LTANNFDFDPNELSQKGLALLNQGSFKESLVIFVKLNSYFPNNPDLLNLIGYANLQLEFFDDALSAYTKSIKINPNQVGVFFNKAIVNEKLGNKRQALEDYDHALKLDPENLDSYQNKSAILEELGKFKDALKNINKVIELSPNNFMALSNRGKIFQALFEHKMAKIDFDCAIKIAPNNSFLYVNRGNFFKNIGKLNEAKKDYLKALKLDKNSDFANYNLAILLLHEKDFKNGWIHYESRFFKIKKPNFYNNIKELKTFDSKQKILIWADQGIGDQVFYGSILQSINSKLDVTVIIDPRLISIFKRSFPHIKFIQSFDYQNKENFTHQLSIISLGRFFRNKTSEFKKLKNFFLKTCEERDLRISKKINNNGKLVCGLSWRSLNKKSGHKKSLKLENLLPILKMENIHFVDIQYDDTTEEIKKFNQKYGTKIQTISGLDKYNDIESVLSLIKCCNFIISIGNATAHFAGSIAKKTFLILPHGMDAVWYWHNDDESLWYPSIEIYRQDKANDWVNPINDIAKRIKQMSV